MITLYRLDTPGAYRVVWLLEELRLLYQIATPAESMQCALSESCAQPTIKDGEITIVGNAAITEYLLNKYDRQGLRPPSASEAYLRYQQWIGITEAILLPLLQQWSDAERLSNARVPFFARSILKKTTQNVLSHPIAESITTLLQQVEAELAQNRWICDSYFSAADIQLTYAIEIASSRGLINQEAFPHCYEFLATVLERPTYQSALDKLASIPVAPTYTGSHYEGDIPEEHA
ncbi:glutathione S-transferase family protein [Pelistega europaea]|uniref:GST C-terminal domain-containing protein n=1 Tax=Pelistega europaea TaxID=106147 RepID=A0A7Y4P3W0_9BURK|nr:glutathione binding-like protein [Pelistega europaea]NOL48856.1 hypothetical protein [Pelistega europaea]